MSDRIVPNLSVAQLWLLLHDINNDGGSYALPAWVHGGGIQVTGGWEEHNAILTLDYVHHLVHDGCMWYTGIYAASVSNNASLDVLIVTGAIRPHFSAIYHVPGNALVTRYRAPEYSSPGSQIGVSNAKDALTGAPLTTIYSGPTITNVGTQIGGQGSFIAGGTGGNRVGNSLRPGVERMYLPNTAYLIRITNLSLQAGAIGWEAEFYEKEI